jgi:hypothetical protein
MLCLASIPCEITPGRCVASESDNGPSVDLGEDDLSREEKYFNDGF